VQFVGIDERDPRRWILRDRNDYMRRWAANDTSGRTVILDMDALSMAPNAPTGLLGEACGMPQWRCRIVHSCKFGDHHLQTFGWRRQRPVAHVVSHEVVPSVGSC
jgi:hypothetical protein